MADYLAGRKPKPKTETTLFGQQGAGLFGQGRAKRNGGIITGGTFSTNFFV
jgi:hypothetical protein